MLSQKGDILKWLHNNVPMMGTEMCEKAVNSLHAFITTACPQAQGSEKELDLLHGCLTDLYEFKYNNEGERIDRIRECLSAIKALPTAPAEKKLEDNAECKLRNKATGRVVTMSRKAAQNLVDKCPQQFELAI